MMNNNHKSKIVRSRALLAAGLCSGAVLLALAAFSLFPISSLMAQGKPAVKVNNITVIHSIKNDVSPALRDLPTLWPPKERKEGDEMREANLNPKLPLPLHVDRPDPVVQRLHLSTQALMAPAIPSPILNFDGIPFPGVGCSCAPPDTNGAVGQTQYVQMVNEGYQVFNKTTGASVLGPNSIVSIWTGFGGVCQSNGNGDPVVLYDHLANRWVITQFAGVSVPTDECIAVSTTNDATGTWFRYDFPIPGGNFMDYPKLGIWPDAYYMSFNVFNSSGTAFLGPQAVAFDRLKMLAGMPATLVTPGITGGASEPSFMPSDLDGLNLPTVGTGNPYISFPGTGTYKVRIFHADFLVPANTTFTQIGAPIAAGFTQLCSGTRACVPENGSATGILDGLGDRLMFRNAYRKFGDGHEAVVGNYSVNSGGVAGVRWFELRAVTTAPVVFQESTYQPDTTWRWMGSVAMDQSGDMAVGFSASSPTLNPQLRYAGRLTGDPLNTLGQGEATLFAGTGIQTSGLNRWGDYSALTVDPVDDCTFWYTNEYIPSNGTFNWATRIGNFKFTQCTSVPTPVIVPTTSSLTAEGCAPANMVIDPNETVTVSFCVQNGGSGPTTGSLTGTLLNTGGVTGASAPQVYGAMAPGATVCLPFTFTATGSCGGTLTATIHFQDGATDLGNAIYTFTMGTLVTTTSFSQNFDGVVAPALPAGWTTTATGTLPTLWVTSTTTPNSAPNDAFVPDLTNIADDQLVSPIIAIPAGGGAVTFKNMYNMESTYDGEVLEISINGGAFADIIAAGGSFVSGGYTGPISTAFQSPIAGRQAWNGLSGGTSAAPAYIISKVNLPAAANGQNIQLKWRAASDNSVAASGAAGVRIDDITISSSTFNCCVNVTPPSLASAVSRLTHGGAGDFDVPLPASSPAAVEDRSSSTYNVVLTFNNGPITSGTAMVTAGTGTAGAPTFSGNTMTVPLTGVANAQTLTLTVNNVNGLLPSASVDIGFLIGDTGGNRSVNSADIGQTKSQSGNAVSGTNFREDVNHDGNINSSDIGLVKSKSGTSIP